MDAKPEHNETLTTIARRALEDSNRIYPRASLDFLEKPWHFQSFARYVLALAPEKGLPTEDLPGCLLNSVLALGPLANEAKEAEDAEKECKKYLDGAFKQLKIKDSGGETAYKPNKKSIPRELALRLCFVLGLNADETEDFFRKGCGTHPFNVRSPYEAACFYCILNHRPYAVVLDLMQQYKEAPDVPEGRSSETRDLIAGLRDSDWTSDEEFLRTFLLPNRPNFTGGSRTTIRTYYELRFDVCHQIIEMRIDFSQNHLPAVEEPISARRKRRANEDVDEDEDEQEKNDLILSGLRTQVDKLEKEEPALSGCKKALTDWSQAGKVLEEIEHYLHKRYPSQEAEARYEDLIDGAVSAHQLFTEMLFYDGTPDKTKKADGEKRGHSEFSTRLSSLSDTAFMTYFPKRKHFPTFETLQQNSKEPRSPKSQKQYPDELSRSPNIRKMIILLFFMSEYYDALCSPDYIRMGAAQKRHQPAEERVANGRMLPDGPDGGNPAKGKTYPEQEFEKFQKKLNDLLDSCNLYPLYDGDPFDWLILKSVWAMAQWQLTEDPIKYFNDVIRLSFPLEEDEETL